MTNRPDEDRDNPLWSAQDFRRARPTAELLGNDVAAALSRKSLRLPDLFRGQSSLLTMDKLAA